MSQLVSEKLKQVANSYRYKPYSYLNFFGVTKEKIDEYFLNEIESFIEKGAIIVTEETAQQINGFVLYRSSSFDTEVLGLKTGKVDIAVSSSPKTVDRLIKNLIQSFIKNQLEYVTIRLNSKDLEMIHALESNGFQLVDGYLVLLKEGGDFTGTTENSNIIIRDAKESDIPFLQEAIAPTFTYSRFFRDSILSESSAKDMHSRWIANSILGKVADHVLVAEDQGMPVGFVTLEMDKDVETHLGKRMGHIPLIGTDPKYRGRNIGLLMSKRAFEGWFHEHQVELIRIETQLINIPATRTYENAGFRLVDSALTFRWSKK